MPASSLRSGTGTRSTPVPLGMNANSWPAFHLWALRTALGIEIWNFAESFAVSGMIIPLFDRSGSRKKLARAEPSRKSHVPNPFARPPTRTSPRPVARRLGGPAQCAALIAPYGLRALDQFTRREVVLEIDDHCEVPA